MASTDSVKVAALKRFAKVIGALVLGAAAGWVAGPDFANVVGTQNAVVLAGIASAVVSALQKVLGEGDGALSPHKGQ